MGLAAILAQTLVPAADGGMVPAAELLVVSYGARQHIRKNALQNLHQEMTTTRRLGSFTMEESLAALVRAERLERPTAALRAAHPEELDLLLSGRRLRGRRIGRADAKAAKAEHLPIASKAPWRSACVRASRWLRRSDRLSRTGQRCSPRTAPLCSRRCQRRAASGAGRARRSCHPAARPRPHRRQGHGQHSWPDHGRGFQHAAAPGAGAGDGRRRGDRRYTTTTNGDGRYEVLDLPAGRYAITVSKGGYVSCSTASGGRSKPARRSRWRTAQAMTGLDLALPKGSVIAGRITDEFGEPVAQAQVSAQRYQYGPDGQRRLQPTGISVTTDDLGQFRLHSLMPGEYIVSASFRNMFVAPLGLGWRRHERRLSAHVSSRHGQCQRGAACHGHARPGIAGAVRAQRGAHGAGVGSWWWTRPAGPLANGDRDADAVQRHRSAAC